MVDPAIRLQNIALEHAELVARRSMTWTESTNRTTMFMAVVGAAVVGLALFAQTGASESLALLALLILSVVLLIGVTTFMRIVQLDEEDMRLVQGLNRLRSLRLELDPGLATYLVTSPHDDFESVLKAYGPDDAPFVYGLATLSITLTIVDSVLAGVVCGLVAVNLGADVTVSVIAGVIAALAFVAAVARWFFKAISRAPARMRPLVPSTDDAAAPGAKLAEASTAAGPASADHVAARPRVSPTRER